MKLITSSIILPFIIFFTLSKPILSTRVLVTPVAISIIEHILYSICIAKSKTPNNKSLLHKNVYINTLILLITLAAKFTITSQKDSDISQFIIYSFIDLLPHLYKLNRNYKILNDLVNTYKGNLSFTSKLRKNSTLSNIVSLKRDKKNSVCTIEYDESNGYNTRSDSTSSNESLISFNHEEITFKDPFNETSPLLDNKTFDMDLESNQLSQSADLNAIKYNFENPSQSIYFTYDPLKLINLNQLYKDSVPIDPFFKKNQTLLSQVSSIIIFLNILLINFQCIGDFLSLVNFINSGKNNYAYLIWMGLRFSFIFINDLVINFNTYYIWFACEFLLGFIFVVWNLSVYFGLWF